MRSRSSTARKTPTSSFSQFKTAVADGYDALIYWPGDQASTPPVVEYLNSTGLPWVALNTVVDPSVMDQVPCMIASDEVEIAVGWAV